MKATLKSAKRRRYTTENIGGNTEDNVRKI